MPFDLSLLALAWMLIAFVVGLLVGATPVLLMLLRARRRIARLRRQVARLTTSTALLAAPSRTGSPREPAGNGSGEQPSSQTARDAASEPSPASTPVATSDLATSEVPEQRAGSGTTNVPADHGAAGAAGIEPSGNDEYPAAKTSTSTPQPSFDPGGEPPVASPPAAGPPAAEPVAQPPFPAGISAVDTDPRLDKALAARAAQQSTAEPEPPPPATGEVSGVDADPMEASLHRIAQLRAQLTEATFDQATNSHRE